MKLKDYLNLPITVTPTVGEEYREHTIVIEYKDGEVAKIENEHELCESEFVSKTSLKDFLESESETASFESPEEYLTGSFDMDEELTEIFQKVNPSIKQVWTAPY